MKISNFHDHIKIDDRRFAKVTVTTGGIFRKNHEMAIYRMESSPYRRFLANGEIVCAADRLEHAFHAEKALLDAEAALLKKPA